MFCLEQNRKEISFHSLLQMRTALMQNMSRMQLQEWGMQLQEWVSGETPDTKTKQSNFKERGKEGRGNTSNNQIGIQLCNFSSFSIIIIHFILLMRIEFLTLLFFSLCLCLWCWRRPDDEEDGMSLTKCSIISPFFSLRLIIIILSLFVAWDNNLSYL